MVVVVEEDEEEGEDDEEEGEDEERRRLWCLLGVPGSITDGLEIFLPRREIKIKNLNK